VRLAARRRQRSDELVERLLLVGVELAEVDARQRRGVDGTVDRRRAPRSRSIQRAERAGITGRRRLLLARAAQGMQIRTQYAFDTRWLYGTPSGVSIQQHLDEARHEGYMVTE
jgi:hypothetical protein